MADAVFEERRLAGIYDQLDLDRTDLKAYLQIVEEVGARTVLDIGCGTGTFCCLLAESGVEVIGLDPAAASLEVARGKPVADRVRWLHGTVDDLPPLGVDLVTMTANVAQVFLTDPEWTAVLDAARSALLPGGHLVFESRDPKRPAWREWTRARSDRRIEIPDVGIVQSWVELVRVDGPLVSFRWTFCFDADGSTMISESTLRFRTQQEILDSLRRNDFEVIDVRDAPDRPGRELIFIARRVEVVD